MQTILMLPIFALMWAFRFLSELTFYVLGFPLVWVLALFKLYRSEPSMYYPRSVLKWRGGWLTWLWGNEEDGIDGAYFRGTGFKYSLAITPMIFNLFMLHLSINP